MGWLQKRPQVSDPVNFYTVGLSKTILFVGLGNPGEKYDGTRHNLGFYCLDAFVRKNSQLGGWVDKKDLKCLMTSGQIGDCRVIAIKPTTFMNSSGEAVQAVANFYKIPAASILVLHDELDIDFGQIRLRQGGSDAGHNGIKSVIQHVGEDFGRIRIGVGPKTPDKIDSADFVLQKFNQKEHSQLPALTRETNVILDEYIFGNQSLPHETRSFLV